MSWPDFRVADLSRPLSPQTPVLPGDPPPRFETSAEHESDGCLARVLHLNSHAGTHVDAPAHILPHGATLDRTPPDGFVGPACVLDLRGDDLAGPERLQAQAGRLDGCEFALLRLGGDELWGLEDQLRRWPAVTVEAARWLAGKGLRGVGLDSPSIDPPESRDLPAHRALLGAGTVIVENLCGLDQLPASGFLFSALPLPLAGGDGSPVRAVALVPR